MAPGTSPTSELSDQPECQALLALFFGHPDTICALFRLCLSSLFPVTARIDDAHNSGG